MEQFVISGELLSAVQTYLSQRPWREVHEAMDALQKLPHIDVVGPPANPPSGQHDDLPTDR